MSRAEERYLECFQDGRLRNCSNKDAFLLGYHKAEKDLELTWEDVKAIFLLVQVEWYPNKNEEEIYQEVLKRFKTQKGEEV